ncbi:MAG: hypothetical protein M3362_06295 [Acidobacteriota bacterium]|nr:hypothetical protein [Acidobacteriota bacterium]
MKLYKKATHALRYWLLRRLPTCKEISLIASQSMDRPLTLRERALVRLHLWVCIWCVWYMEQLRFLRLTLRARAARMSGTDSVGASLSAEARERIKSALKSGTNLKPPEI